MSPELKGHLFFSLALLFVIAVPVLIAAFSASESPREIKKSTMYED